MERISVSHARGPVFVEMTCDSGKELCPFDQTKSRAARTLGNFRSVRSVLPHSCQSRNQSATYFSVVSLGVVTDEIGFFGSQVQ